MNETTNDTNATGSGQYAAHTLKYGGRAHKLTPEEARRGALRSAEKKREAKRRAKMSLNEHIAEKLEQEAERIVEGFISAGREGDWRAYDSLMDRYLGKPTQRTETVDVSQGSAFEELSEEERDQAIRQVRAKLELVRKEQAG